MPPSYDSASRLRPLLEECGYTGSLLRLDYRLDPITIPLAGFASEPLDFDSACIAVVDGNGNPEFAARSCRNLGSPVVWVHNGKIVDWWMQHDGAPTCYASKPVNEFTALVRDHREQLGPGSIYRGKTIARVDKSNQLDFVDAGFLPLLREEAGKKLHDLVEAMTRAALKGLGQGNPGPATIRDVFTAVFRMLAGKILKDKGVPGFKTLDLTDPVRVLAAVARHYSDGQTAALLSGRWPTALSSAAAQLSRESSFGVVSPETLAYVYEHTLVTPLLREKLGIHATPPWLVDYIVWHLYDWICEIPAGDRHVFEPGCGHAPFLLSAMRLLRMETQDHADMGIHAYLREHLHGTEIDDFAREIARLSLTLADIPHPNGWDLRSGDMFASDVLMREAAKCRILLSNPPYESFDTDGKRRCESAGHPVTHKKAVELLRRTLSKLPPGGIFGVLVPQSVVNGPEAKTLREELLANFEIAEVCLFPGKVFEFAEIETAIILGRRLMRRRHKGDNRVRLRTVGEQGIKAFQERYAVTHEIEVYQSRLSENSGSELTVPMLGEVWKSLANNKHLGEVAKIGRGIEFKGEAARGGNPAVIDKATAGYVVGYSRMRQGQMIFETPPEVGISLDNKLINNAYMGMPTGKPQVLVNMGRSSRSPWRIKAVLDVQGRPAKNNFVIIRPTSRDVNPLYLWAILNSPVASAYVASRTMRRHNYERFISEIPIPQASGKDIREVVGLAERYREIALTLVAENRRGHEHAATQQSLFDSPPQERTFTSGESEVREALLTLDAAVLRLYRLPMRLERELLDFFNGHERRGTACVFGNYFPADFESLMPLYKYISSTYRNSTPERFGTKPGPIDPVVCTALRAATTAFGGDE